LRLTSLIAVYRARSIKKAAIDARVTEMAV
jgi:hypothetical protein